MFKENPRIDAQEVKKFCTQLLLILLLLLLVQDDTSPTATNCPPRPEPLPGFLTAEDLETQRFAGANIFWLLTDYVDHQTVYPSKEHIDEVLAALSDMGGNIIRTHGVSLGCPLCVESELDIFNDQAFAGLDYALDKAKEYDFRFIIPLIDRWEYYHGGIYTFLKWFERTNPRDFFYDPEIIAAYERYIAFVLNHRNPYDGLKYSENPQIAIWATGNEVGQYLPFLITDWTQRIAAFIRQQAPNQLIMDGQAANLYAGQGLNEEILQDCNVDVFDYHAYPPVPNYAAQLAHRVTNIYDKHLMVTEYGEQPIAIPFPTYLPSSAADFQERVLSGEIPNLSGVLFWNLDRGDLPAEQGAHNNAHTKVHGDAFTAAFARFAEQFIHSANQEMVSFGNSDS